MRIALASGEAASVAPGASVSCIWLSVVPANPSDTFNAQAVEAAARELLSAASARSAASSAERSASFEARSAFSARSALLAASLTPVTLPAAGGRHDG